MSEINYILGYKCPKCESVEPFYIEVITLATVWQDGTEETHGFSWDENSFCECVECNHTGRVEDFHVQNTEDIS